MEYPRISIVGLGKLGSCMAACLAYKGFDVIGLDVNSEIVDKINAGEAPVLEPELQEMLSGSRERLRATQNYQEAILNSDITFFVVPTPSDEDGSFSLEYVVQAGREAARALKKKNDYHLFVLTSTVLPGSTQCSLLSVLEDESGKKCGPDFGLCYSPEFIALGSVIQNFLNPDFILIGESDERAGKELEMCMKYACDNAPPIKRMNFTNAELTKISINTFVTTKITFANMLSAICEKLPDGNVDVVTNALGFDSRIGKKYLKGGLGYGGPCFPRDNAALTFLADQLGEKATLAESTYQLNKDLGDRLVSCVLDFNEEGDRAAILGLSYKPNSNVVEESQSVYLAERLAKKNIEVSVFDPIAIENCRKVLGDLVEYAETIQAAISNADVVVVANPDPAFKSLGIEDFQICASPVTIIDCWRFLGEDISSCSDIEYVPVGIARENELLLERMNGMWNRDGIGAN